MIGDIILVVYLLGYILSVPKFAWVILDTQKYMRPQPFDIGMSYFAALLTAWFWPPIVPIYKFKHSRFAPTDITKSFLFAPPAHVKKEVKQNRLERENREQAERIRQLERDALKPLVLS